MKAGDLKIDTEVMTSFETNAAMKTRIGIASDTADGLLSKDDHRTFSAKTDKSYVDTEVAKREPANANIQQHVTATGNPHGTKTGDIAESNDKLFTSAAEKSAWNAKQDKISTLEVFRTSNLTFTADTYADVFSLDLSKGVWLVMTNLSIKSPLNLGQKVSAKIWDGTTVFTSGESSAGALGLNLAGWTNIALATLVTVTTTTPKTVKVSAASSAASVLAATIGDYSTGATNTANSMRAIRIG